jgi:hypothetical protein
VPGVKKKKKEGKKKKHKPGSTAQFSFKASSQFPTLWARKKALTGEETKRKERLSLPG